MKFLPDQVVARLQNEIQTPDLSATRYRAIKLLGSGGMGSVWLVEDNVLNRAVALKVLNAETSREDLAAGLLQEARVLARLEHPGIVPVHDAGTLADGRTFYCMKHVEGQTLDQHVVGLSLLRRLQLLQRIAEPLAFAHARGIVHRDLKPGNIMVGAFGEVVVMDWGLAKLVSSPAGAEALPGLTGPSPDQSRLQLREHSTAHGAVLGTPGYMAPEQVRGEVDQIDQRTDVFGLGAILEFMLAPMPGSNEGPVPKRLLAICRKATSARMPERYSSMQELAADIGRYIDDLPVNAYRENVFERAVRLLKRNRVAVVLVLAYLLMRMLFILFSRR